MTKLSNKQRREAEEAGQEEQQQKKKKAHERRVQEANPLQKAQQKDQALKHMAETLPLPAPNQRVYTRLFCIVRLYDNPQEAIKALHAAGKLEAFMTFSVEMMTHMDSVTEALSQTQLYERARDYHIFWELAMCGGDLIGSFSPYGSVLCRGDPGVIPGHVWDKRFEEAGLGLVFRVYGEVGRGVDKTLCTYISEHPELQLNPYLPCPAVDYEWGSRKPGTGWTSIRLLHPVEADKGDMPMQPCDMPYGNWAELCGVIAFVAAARDALLPVNPKGVIGHQPAVVSVAVDCRIEGPSRCF